MSKRRRRRNRRLQRFFIIVIAIAVIFGVIGGYGLKVYNGYMEDYKGTETTTGEDVVVEIPEGSSVKKIAAILHEKGLIDYERAFVERVKESEYRGKLKYGTYTLNTGMNTLQMIEIIGADITGPEVLQTFMVPEGYSIEQIAAKAAEQNICTEEEFINAVSSAEIQYDFLNDIPGDAAVKYRLQGFLFPATYNIYETTTAESLVDAMLKKFDEVYSSLGELVATSEYSTFEIITMASIIEREAKVAEERPIIAGVLFNRLEINMALQMCPTVLYPITDGRYDKSTVTYADLEVDSPYNTYKNPGLPVGPICNPGESSIRAILAPQEHNYLYYHVDDEAVGNHIFSETYDEHVETQN